MTRTWSVQGEGSAQEPIAKIRRQRRRRARTVAAHGVAALGLSLILIGGGSLAAPAVTGTTVANLYAQEKSNWCWVAVSKTVINHYKATSPSQCSVYKWGKAASSCTANTVGSFYTDVDRALKGGGIGNRGTAETGTNILMSAFRGEVDAKRVMLIRWGWLSTNLQTGHMIAIGGYNTTTNQVQVVNPAGSGSKVWKDRGWVMNDGSHKTTHLRWYIQG